MPDHTSGVPKKGRIKQSTVRLLLFSQRENKQEYGILFQNAGESERQPPFEIVFAESLASTIERITTDPFDVIFLDSSLTASDVDALIDFCTGRFHCLPLFGLVTSDKEQDVFTHANPAIHTVFRTDAFLSQDFRALFQSFLTEKSNFQNLHARQEKLHSLIHHSVNGILVIDIENTILFFNIAAMSLLEKAFSTVIGAKLDFPLICGKPFDIELKNLDGTVSTVEIHVTQISWSNAPAYLITLNNISGRKSLELALQAKVNERTMQVDEINENLQKSVQRFELVMDAATVGIWDWDIVAGKVLFSLQWKEMLGYADDELASTFVNWIALIHPEDLGKFLMIWSEYMEGVRKRFSMEYRLQSKSGEYIWLEVMGTRYLNESGAPHRMAGTHMNIHTRKCAELELQEYREKLEHLIEERTAELKKANETLERIAALDALTGIPNRRSLDATLEQESRRSARDHGCISILMIDIDFFKVYNDRFGHQAGDQCLICVANAISRACTRTADFVGRYGGEEFAVVLPYTASDGALHLAELIRQTVQELKIPAANLQASDWVSVSIGVSTGIPAGSATDFILKAADDALYQAKKAGRNRVLFNPVPAQS